MVSSTPMSADAFYEAFLSILQVYGFVAVPSGGVMEIAADANARQLPGWEGDANGDRRADDIVTQVVPVHNISAAQLVPILPPIDTPVRASRRLPRIEHADYFRPCS